MNEMNETKNLQKPESYTAVCSCTMESGGTNAEVELEGTGFEIMMMLAALIRNAAKVLEISESTVIGAIQSASALTERGTRDERN